MRAFLRAISLGGFTAFWLSRLCGPASATSNITYPDLISTTPPPPYALQDPAIHPGSPTFHDPSPPNAIHSNTVEAPVHALVAQSNFTIGPENQQVFWSDLDAILPALSSSSSGSPPWPNSSQPILAEVMAVHMVRISSEPVAAHGQTPESTAEDSNENLEAQPITQEQLIEEVKGMYAGLVMVEKKCIEIDEQICRNPKSLSEEQWQATIALHRTLLHEHHDFFLASQRPSSSAAVKRLAMKYAMPARMWRHGIRAFLEILHHRLPDSLDHMRTSVYSAYALLALLMEAEPSFINEWIESLSDLARYRMIIEEVDLGTRDIRSGCAGLCNSHATHRSPNCTTQEHLTVLNRPTITRRPQQNRPERQLPGDFPMRGLLLAQHYYPPEFFQGQAVDGDVDMPDMPFSTASGAGKFDTLLSDPRSCVPEYSGANEENVLDFSSVPEASTSNLHNLQSASPSCASGDPSSSYALNESVSFPGIGDVFLGEMVPDTETPAFNSDDFMPPEIPEPPSVNPLNNLFNPEMTFSMDVDESDTGPLVEDHYLAPGADWNLEFEVHMMHEVPESRPVVELNQKFPVTVDGKSNENDQTEAGSPALWKSNKAEEQAISSTDTLLAKPDKIHSLPKDNKPNRNISDAPDQESRSLPTQTEVLSADTVDPAHIGGDRMKPQGIFFLLLVQLQRGSPNSLGTTRGGGAVLIVLHVVLLLLAIVFSRTQRL